MSRGDKKRQIRPHVPRFVKEFVHDVSTYLKLSEGDAGVRLVLSAISDFPTLNRLAPYMWRDYVYGMHAWIGHRNPEDLDRIVNPKGEIVERLSMRFKLDDWASIDALSFAFGKPVAHAAAALLRLTYDTPRVTQLAAPGFTPRSPYTLERGFYQWGGSTR